MDNFNWIIVSVIFTSAVFDNIYCQVVPPGGRQWKWCFVCSGKAPDRECESFPQYVANGRINCTRRYCTTTVKYDAKRNSISFDDKGISETARPLTPKDLEVVSIARNCEDLPRGNRCVRDRGATFTCYSTCRQDYCNAETRAPTWSDLNINRLRRFPLNETDSTQRRQPATDIGRKHDLANSNRYSRPQASARELAAPEFNSWQHPFFHGHDSGFVRTGAFNQRFPKTETLGVRPLPHAYRPNQLESHQKYFQPSNRLTNPRLILDGNRIPLPMRNSVGPYRSSDHLIPSEYSNPAILRQRTNYPKPHGNAINKIAPVTRENVISPLAKNNRRTPSGRMAISRDAEPLSQPVMHTSNPDILVRRPLPSYNQRFHHPAWDTKPDLPQARNIPLGYGTSGLDGPSKHPIHSVDNTTQYISVITETTTHFNIESMDRAKNGVEESKGSLSAKDYDKKIRIESKRDEFHSKEPAKASETAKTASEAVATPTAFTLCHLMTVIICVLNNN